MSLPIAIIAGGLATRLKPITEKIPKALINIAGEPFIAHQLRHIKNQGIDKVVLCLGHLGEMIESFVGDGSNFDLEVNYSFDGEPLLGTGGAIKKSLPLLGDAFFVMYGDSYLPISFKPVEKAFLNSKKSALMTIIKNDNLWDKSNVIYKEHDLIEYNKKNMLLDMEYIDYGLSIIKSSIFSPYEDLCNFDLADIFHNISINNELQGYEVKDRFYEIGSYQGIKDAEEYLLKTSANKLIKGDL
jgi:MurNAc alpha-1-phosphate uridylyltransferase